jgi:hypothetical protein
VIISMRIVRRISRVMSEKLGSNRLSCRSPVLWASGVGIQMCHRALVLLSIQPYHKLCSTHR